MKRWFALLFGVWALVGATLVALVVGVPLVLPFAILRRGRRERFSIYGAVVWAWICVRCVLWVRVRIEGELDLEDGEGALLVCNHRSWLDPMLLIGWGRSNGLSKLAIRRLPLIGAFGHLSGAVFFDRNDKKQRAFARAEVMELINGGHRIQLFPEGTRTTTGEIRHRVYLALPRDAFAHGVTIVPCAVLHTERVLPVDHWAAYPFQEVVVRFGKPMRPAHYEDDVAFATAAWEQVKQMSVS